MAMSATTSLICSDCGANENVASSETLGTLCGECFERRADERVAGFADGRGRAPWRLGTDGVSRGTPSTVRQHQGGVTRQHQDQDQDQDQDQELPPLPSLSSSSPGVVSEAPGVVSEFEPDVIEIALAEYTAGNLVPIEIQLGPMPQRAGPLMVAVAEHMRLLIGLRLAMGETRPLPYATSVPVRFNLVPDKGAASRVIRRLVSFGVIEYAGTLKALSEGRDGTKLYTPPGGMPDAAVHPTTERTR